ncbi:MAG: hypothetical protein KDN05_22415, partial [Verrucomicrobiae bacterium]|nr:hypothetical protein [Verrucomicrobiae bacterium]
MGSPSGATRDRTTAFRVLVRRPRTCGERRSPPAGRVPLTGVVISGKTAIPVRNLWLLMLYASKLYATNESIRGADAEDRPDELPDLVAEILARAVERRLKRNLSQEYVRRHEPLTRVRGRIDIL